MSGFGSGSTDWPPMTARAADKCDEFPSPHGFAHAKDHLGYERNITFWMKNFGWRIVPFVTPKPGRPDVRFGSKADIGHLRAMSALPPKADIGTQPPDVRFVPKADIGPFTQLSSRRAARSHRWLAQAALVGPLCRAS